MIGDFHHTQTLFIPLPTRIGHLVSQDLSQMVNPVDAVFMFGLTKDGLMEDATYVNQQFAFIMEINKVGVYTKLRKKSI